MKNSQKIPEEALFHQLCQFVALRDIGEDKTIGACRFLSTRCPGNPPDCSRFISHFVWQFL